MSSSSTYLPAARELNLNFDKYLNKIIPPSPLHRLPRLVSRFLGYRERTEPDVGNILIAFWALIGAFAGLVLVAGVFRASPWIQSYSPPVLIASLGAAAVLEYNAIASPLAQPRNTFIGHCLCAFIGVAVAKASNGFANYDDVRWLLGPLACALASAAMTLTNSVHPPGGATAVLAVIDPAVRGIGWTLVLFVLIACLLTTIVALLVNNVQRRYPTCWWSPLETGTVWKRAPLRKAVDVESLSTCVSHPTAGSVQGVDVASLCCTDSITLSSGDVLSILSDLKLDEHERAVLAKLLAKLQAPRMASNTTEKSC